jgi:hypothetical protein
MDEWELTLKGEIVSTLPEYSFEVQEPTIITAVWEKGINTLNIGLLVLLAVIAISLGTIILRKLHDG